MKKESIYLIKNKSLRIIFSVLFLLVCYLGFFLSCKKISFLNFSYDLLFLFSIAVFFILFHIWFDLKKMYEFIYRYRYLFGLLLLAVLVIGKYNGSSIQLWNDNVQPGYKLDSKVIIGIPRAIRSDEWLVSTPSTLTQATDTVNFSLNNTILSAKNNLVSLYPNLPSKDISILSTPHNLGYLFLDKERAFSLSWYLPYFILLFATFELFMILTNKNKLYSITGASLITFSPVIQWWQSANIIAYGALAVTLFYYLINCKDLIKKILLSIVFGYSGFLYIMCLYPAWQVPYGYVYLILLIWIIVANKEKIKKFDFLYLIPIFLTIIIPIYIIFKQNYDVLTIVNSTVYPGARMSTGGGEWRTLFTYLLDILYPYKSGFGNPCEFSQYLSLYPLPIVYSIYIMIKNKKRDLFLILSNIVILFLSIWVIFPLPGIISKLTLIYMSTETRAQVAIGYLSIIQFIYILSHYEIIKIDKKKNYFKNIIVFLISSVFLYISIKISNNLIKEVYPLFVNRLTSVICFVVFLPIVYLFIYNHKKTNYLLSIMLIIIALLSGILVSPINKGLSVMYEKPLAKEIQTLVSNNKDSIYLVTDSGFLLPNYIAVNGAKTINTTNQVPNLDLYYVLDPELNYDNIYNRYHHLIVNLTNNKTNFVLNQDDLITLNLNYNDVCKTKADYIISSNSDVSLYKQYKKIYDEYGTFIYKTNCKER